MSDGGRFSPSYLFSKEKTMRKFGRVVASSMVALVLSTGMVPVAMASGAGGGSFTCDKSGIPGWGHVTSSYLHPTKSHYATAKGTGYVTIQAGGNKWAVAKTGRALKNNQCYWGVY
ncbi:lactococcin 972 family bacteriocin [Bifidobacterium sp. B14384H11]|nr:lactococcin 972 family bacteriocin [Bifidobacterium choladohabitans]